MTKYYKTECEVVSDYGDVKLDKNDTRYSLVKDSDVFNFVGFIFENDKLLSVFPKHFFDNGEEGNTDSISLLFNVICKYNRTEKANVK